MPELNTLTKGIFASLAQHERELISNRTQQALAAKRARGEKLGTSLNLSADGVEPSDERNSKKMPTHIKPTCSPSTSSTCCARKA
jgi:DNA invertase Pin-like site-specific DNA recombinase